jgi:hypothetical protein
MRHGNYITHGAIQLVVILVLQYSELGFIIIYVYRVVLIFTNIGKPLAD